MEKSKDQAHAEVLITLSNQMDLAGKGLNPVLTSLTETVAHTLDADQVSIWQFDPKGQEIRCLTFYSRFDTVKPDIAIDLTPYKTYLMSLQTEQSIVCSEVLPDKRVADLPPVFWVDSKVKSCLHIPVRTANQITAILRVESRSVHPWSEADIYFCARVADQIAQALLANELSIRDERAMTFRSLTTDLVHRYELPTLLKDLVHKCVKMLNASDGALYLADPERRMVIPVAGHNLLPDDNNQMIHYGEQVVGKVAETGQELLIKDYRTWIGRLEAVKRNEPFTTILCIPMRTRGEIVGVLQLTRRNGNQPFTKTDQDTLTEFANLACMAIEQSRLLETNQRLHQFQVSMKEIVETTTFASSVSDFLETATDYIVHALAAQFAAIHIEDVVAQRGFPDEIHQQIDGVLTKRGKRFNPVIAVHDVGVSDSGYRDLAEVMQGQKMRSYILAPIPMNYERIGYVCVASKTARTWTEDEKRLLETAATQIGLAIEGIRYYQESLAQVDIIKRMTSVTSALNRLVSMDDLIPTIGEGAVRLFNPDGLAVILREQSDVVHASWVFGLLKTDFSQAVASDGKELLSMFAAVVDPMLVTNIAKSSLPKQIKAHLMATGFKSIRLAPITYSGNVIGVIAGFYEKVMDWSPRDRQMMVTFTNTVALALQNTWAYEQLEKGYMNLAVSLAETVESRESQVKAVPMRVADWAQRTAELIGMSRDEQDVLRWAALLHDIGKVEVPDEVIMKRGPLTTEEKRMLQHYPLKSETLVSPMNNHGEIGCILRGLREHYDGSGYPDKRRGNDIPLAARILAVVDAYSSMIDERPYRSAKTHEAAVDEIRKNSGKQFDPDVVNAFLRAVTNKPQFVN